MDVFRQWTIDLINQIVNSINSFQHIILSILGFDISDAGLVMTGIQSAALSLAGLFLAIGVLHRRKCPLSTDVSGLLMLSRDT